MVCTSRPDEAWAPKRWGARKTPSGQHERRHRRPAVILCLPHALFPMHFALPYALCPMPCASYPPRYLWPGTAPEGSAPSVPAPTRRGKRLGETWATGGSSIHTLVIIRVDFFRTGPDQRVVVCKAARAHPETTMSDKIGRNVVRIALDGDVLQQEQ